MSDAPTTSPDTGGEAFDVDVQFEVWQDDAMVASADSLSDAVHFMAIYGQDGPVRAVTAVTHRFDGFAAPAAEVKSHPPQGGAEMRSRMVKTVRPLLDRQPMIDSSQSHKLDIQAGWIADAILAALPAVGEKP